MNSNSIETKMLNLASELFFSSGNTDSIINTYNKLKNELKPYALMTDDNPLLICARANGFVIPGEDVSYEEVFDEIDRVYKLCLEAEKVMAYVASCREEIIEQAERSLFSNQEEQEAVEAIYEEIMAKGLDALEKKRKWISDNKVSDLEEHITQLLVDVKKWEM